MAAARSPGSTISASCMSGRNRPAPCPGPAAYGRGGDKATTTDANLWLGRINRDYFCGGEVIADMAAAEAAISDVASRSSASIDEAARGIIRIANNNMVNALKLVSLNRGHDPRDFTLVAFGGGGAMHAVALAAELGVRRSWCRPAPRCSRPGA
jgi:N-methylhydantoinase A